MKLLKVSGIILAAGNGGRFGEKKQFVNFKGKPVWRWSYDTAKKVLDDVVVVGINERGGRTRQQSVAIGLSKAKHKYVIIFDAARPLVTVDQIKKIARAVKKHPSVSFGVELTDTIYSQCSYRRDGYVALQVPQAFNTKMLIRAHRETLSLNVTDDTFLFLHCHNISPKIIKGGRNLHKITYKEDLKILKNI